jgi:8-hydroxy-5-deazaflavin:NADPH oxidoreductase
MKITIIGRGGVGAGLARLLEAAGHGVTTLGRDGGDASDADVVIVAVPGNAIEDAIGKVPGIEGKTVLDATNPLEGRPDGVDSLAQQVKSLTHGPVAKAFNANFERLYGDVSSAGNRPSALYCGDDEAREIAEQLTRDAGYEPVYAGGLENARALEDFVVGVMLPVLMAGRGPFFYRIGGAEEL